MLNYKKMRDLINMNLIKKSGFFDVNYYRREYPNVKNPLKHYYYEGFKMGYNPSKLFSNNYYLNHNSDVKKAGINPLLHYILSGKDEGRKIKKVTGITISDLYKKIMGNNGYISVYLKNNITKNRISVFTNSNDYEFLMTMINKSAKLNKICRIIYTDLDLNKLNMYCKDENISLDDVEFYKYNSNCLLDVYLDEVFACNEYDILFSLLNTIYISKPIYFYVDNSKLNDEIVKWLSYYNNTNNVVLFGKDEVSKYNLVIDNKLNNRFNNNINICLDMEDFSFEILMMFQEFFMNHYIDKKIKLYYHNEKYNKDISFKNNTKVSYVSDINNMDVIIHFSYDENSNNDINVYFEKLEGKIKVIDDINFDDKKMMKECWEANFDIDKVGDK